eukprot:gb/GECH01002169.1/.p1 GENE.gb/GECH01002169.1/~~gb/GECH01002169.1/.p1  ORF type:complete len:135 (+),score=14.22 gb/GECH01002169.1/:1-405(+)
MSAPTNYSLEDAKVTIEDSFEAHDAKSKPYIVYVLQIVLQDGTTWTTHRRYSEFREVHSALKKQFGKTYRNLFLESNFFPSKKMVGNLDSQFVERRKDALADWLYKVCSAEDIRDAPGVRDLLMEHKIVQPVSS